MKSWIVTYTTKDSRILAKRIVAAYDIQNALYMCGINQSDIISIELNPELT